MFSMTNIQIESVVTGYHVYRRKLDIGTFCFVLPECDNAFDKTALVVKHNGAIIGHVPAKPVLLKSAMNDVLELSQSIQIKCEIIGAPTAAFVPWASNVCHSGAVIPCRYTMQMPVLMVSAAKEILVTYIGKELSNTIVKCFDVYTSPASPSTFADWKSMTP